MAGVPTGKAFINVGQRGKNQTVVIAGANAKLNATDMRAQAGLIRRSRGLRGRWKCRRRRLRVTLDVCDGY